MNKSLRMWAVLALELVSAAALGADHGEAVFKAALAYTVQVRTAVATPLEGDLKGTQRGAGFVVDAARGWVMTNAHVVSRSPSRVEIAGHDGTFVEASKLYVDPHLDLAIVVIPEAVRAGVRSAPLECATIPSVGHPVGAFGHPWNLPFTGTRGIVSGVATRAHQELLQTDAPINAGNSGGPLISLDTGRVVGINTAQIRGSQNTNFAVAAKYACRILELLEAGVDPSPPELHVVYYNEQDADLLKVARNYGGPEGTPLQPGDVIRGVTGSDADIRSETQLFDLLRGHLDSFDLRVRRSGQEIVVHGSARPQARVVNFEGVLAGGVLFAATPLRDIAEVRVGALMIHHVDSGTDGDAKELRRGDFLEAVDGHSVSTLAELEARLAVAGGTVTLTLKRYGGGDRVFTYIERRLHVTRIERVADHPIGVGVASAAIDRHAN